MGVVLKCIVLNFNIKIDLRVIRYGGMDWIYLA
jgi:hypothetical protein